MIRSRAIVLGGGIGGMAAALILADRGFAVELVEAGPRLGAGWRTVPTASGPADLGIRVPQESGDARADALVFHADAALAWNRLGPRPAEGHVALGRLNADTPCPDARALPAPLLAQAREEVIARAFTPDPGGGAPHLAARLAAVFGPTLLDHLLRPACRALLGAEPEALAPGAAQSRLPARVAIAGRAETEALHATGFLAARLAHPRAAEAPGRGDTRSYLYPKAGGIGRWTASLEASLLRAGVAIRTGSRVCSLRHAGPRIAAVRLSDGPEIPCDLLVLAAAPRALPGLPPVPETVMPVTARLLTVAGAAPPPLDWIASYDPATPFLRLGFPDRLEGREVRAGAPWRVAAEMRGEEPAPLPHLPPGARIVADMPVGTGRFAVETAATRIARDAALAETAGISNLAVLRSATGGHALVGELVADAAALAEAATSRAAA